MTAEASAIDNATQPKVIIRCLVYNHEPYLRDCLEGFVMQKTNFPFKAVVHDDCSTDGSAAIIREFAEKYPDIIEPIYETENQYSKRDGSLGRIMDAATLGRSPYIAYCEGDDYWIDPLKLQKQVDFLESHPDYSMCFHKAKIIVHDGRNYYDYFSKLEEREYHPEEILIPWIIPTASIMMRASTPIPFHKDFRNGDVVIHAACVAQGRVYCMRGEMSIYRLHGTGSSAIQRKPTYQLSSMIPHYLAMMQSFNRNIAKYYKPQASIYCLLWLRHFQTYRYEISLFYFFKALYYCNFSLLYWLIKIVIKKMRKKTGHRVKKVAE